MPTLLPPPPNSLSLNVQRVAGALPPSLHRFRQGHEPIGTAVFRAHTLGSQRGQHLSRLAGIASAESGRILLLQTAENLGGRKQPSLLAFLRQTEALKEKVLLGRVLVEQAVVLLNRLLLCRGEPRTFARQQLGLQLGIELRIVGTGAVNLLLHLHTEEASASRGVGQQLLLVARADEGGDAGQLAVLASVRLAEGELFQLHQVFQGGHRSDAVSVELIHIDKAEERELLFASAHAGDIELVDVKLLQLFG